MKKVVLFFAITVTGLIIFLLFFFANNKTVAKAVCVKNPGETGTCAQVVHTRNIFGLNNKYYIQLTPTNSGNFESDSRSIKVNINQACVKQSYTISWTAEGVVVGDTANRPCIVITRESIGQW